MGFANKKKLSVKIMEGFTLQSVILSLVCELDDQEMEMARVLPDMYFSEAELQMLIIAPD